MKNSERTRDQQLFESLSDEETRWQFVILCDHGWAITRNGVRVSVGTHERVSIEAGIATFTALIRGVATFAECDPAVQSHLDRIERKIQRGVVQGAISRSRRAIA